MMLNKKLFRRQLAIAINGKFFIISFVSILVMVLTNYLINVMNYRGADIIEMIQPTRLLLLNEFSTIGQLFILLFPILCVFSTFDLYQREKRTSLEKLLCLRCHTNTYLITTLATTFVIAFTTFFVPLIIELLFTCLSFPMRAIGTQGGYGIYTEYYAEDVSRYLLGGFAVEHPMFYAFVVILICCLVGALIAVLSQTIAMAIKYPFQILYFIPAFVTLYLPGLLAKWITKEDTSYIFYLRLYDTSASHPVAAIIVLVVIILMTILFLIKRKCDDLL